MANINIDQLASEIAKGLAEYSQDVIEGIDASSKKIASKAVKRLKADSPKDSGEYAKGWGRKTEKKFGETNTIIIYNKTKPGLTHLLEHGHAKRGGGRTKAKPHIGPVEQQVIEEFTSEVEKVIKGG